MSRDRRIPGTGSREEIRPGVWRLYEPGGVDRSTGKRYRPSHTFYGTDAEAERELQKLCAAAGRVSGSAITLWDFIETMYLPAIQPPELMRRTVDGYTEKLTRYVKPSAIASSRMDKLTRFAMVSWMREVKTKVANKQTQLHIYSALSAALGRAVEWGILEENVLRKAVKPPIPDEHHPLALTEDQANDYLDAFVGHPLEPVVVIQIAAGTRPEEVYAVEWSDIDFEARTLRIEKTLHQRKGEVWLDDTKSRESKRTVMLPQWALDALKPHRGIGRIIGDLTPNQVAWRYKSFAKKQPGLVWCPLENLRHTCATIGTERGISDEDMARMLGHTSTKMVRERYVQRRVMRAEASAQVMEGVRRTKPVGEQRDAR